MSNLSPESLEFFLHPEKIRDVALINVTPASKAEVLANRCRIGSIIDCFYKVNILDTTSCYSLCSNFFRKNGVN